jgi:hypothetical protein
MICLRCGQCCVNLDVSIVNPESIRPDGTVYDLPGSMISKPKGQRCPHLICQDGQASCTIHALPCYAETPCQQFEQFGREDDICTFGSYFRTTKKIGEDK